MISFELEDKEGLDRLVDIYPISENEVKVVVDEDEITINPSIFKHREKLNKFCKEIFDEENAKEIIFSVYSNDELEGVMSLNFFDSDSKNKVKRFKDGLDL